MTATAMLSPLRDAQPSRSNVARLRPVVLVGEAVEAERVPQSRDHRRPAEVRARGRHRDVAAERYHDLVQPDQGAERGRVDEGDARGVDLEGRASGADGVVQPTTQLD